MRADALHRLIQRKRLSPLFRNGNSSSLATLNRPRVCAGTIATFGSPVMVENISPSLPTSPLRYELSFEQLEKDEKETDAALTKTMLGISETTFKDGGRGLRSVHAKSHGLLTGSFRVLNELPAVLAQGIAASPTTYPVVVRLSTTPGDILDDSVSTPRALALKIIAVEGSRLVETRVALLQDFGPREWPCVHVGRRQRTAI